MSLTYKIVGIGEILWDIFPARKRIGGAPANFAFHCHQLGANAFPVSALGADELGELTRRELRRKDVDASYIQVAAGWPTSRVLVSLSEHGKPVYEIIENVAWDHLLFTDELARLAPTIDAVCFGVLSQRGEITRTTIQNFLAHMSESSIKIFDINLRQFYFSKELVEQCLKSATVLKLSDEELPQLAEYFNLKGTVMEQLTELREQFTLDLIAYTRGDNGSILNSTNEIDEHSGLDVTVVDSVGAGDSFTAALCTGLLKGWPLNQVNEFANKVAAYVCSQKGATPELPTELISKATDTITQS